MYLDFEDLHDGNGDGSYDMVYMNKTVDICNFLKNKRSNAIFAIIYRLLSDYGNLPQTCPLRKVHIRLKIIKSFVLIAVCIHFSISENIRIIECVHRSGKISAIYARP